ncbi:MAG: hydrogenase [candidate division WS1 bacterium]|jgi:NAD(P)H-flavin reductase|nr:hydrogenase [candidate division WS1 bacterium]
MGNPYLPHLATLTTVREEGPGLMTFEAQFQDPEVAQTFTYMPGQFIEVSVFGVGEAPFGVASVAGPGRPIRFSVQKVGLVTTALHGLSVGATIGLRGPFGNGFPVLEHRGKNIFLVGGGIGLPPLRSVIDYLREHCAEYGEVTVIYGARSPQLLVYKECLLEWGQCEDLDLCLTVDRGDETWEGHEGFVPSYLEELNPSPENAVAYTVGPPIMIKFVLETFDKLGWPRKQVFASLEAKMKCGLGKCGRCNCGPKLVCLHGPVFSAEELADLPWI